MRKDQLNDPHPHTPPQGGATSRLAALDIKPAAVSASHVKQALGVWLFLVTATLCSAWLAEHHALAGRWTAVVVMAIAALKGRAVILYFMELKAAPWAWRMAFELWIWLCAALIVTLWALGGSEA